jgi:hypothetical protein
MTQRSLLLASDLECPEHFSVHGWMRVRAEFTAKEAAAMRAVIWRALAAVGICDRDPSTWTKERPEHLQHARSDPAFRAVGSARLLEAIDAVLEGQVYGMAKNWGALFSTWQHRTMVMSRGSF